MIIRKSIAVILFIWLSLLIACNSEIPKGKFSLEQIDNCRHEFNLPASDTYILDSSYLPDLLSLLGKVDSETVKNHYQPLQAMYFDQKGRLVSFHVNCYAGIGVDAGQALNWNQKNAFETFVPSTVAPLDTLFKFADLTKYIRRFDGQQIDTIGFSQDPNIIVVFWNKSMLGRDARNLIHLVQENSKSKRARIIYVNCDNMLR